MKHIRISQILLAVLLGFAAAGAARAADTRNGPAPAAQSVAYVGGTYAVTFNVQISSALPTNAAILCKARAVPNWGRLEGFGSPTVPVMSSTVAVGSSAGGSWANCTVQVPFYWIGNMGQAGALLSYEIDTVSGPGAIAVPVRVASGIAVAYPTAGGTTHLRFDMRL